MTVELIPSSIKAIRMSDEEYFSDKYKNYISNSKLSLINPAEGGSYEKFISGFNTDYSDSMELGSAVHAMILQPDDYIISPLIKPNGKLGKFVEEVIKFRKQGLSLEKSFYEASISANYFSGKLKGKRLQTAIIKGLPFYLKKFKEEEIEGKTIINLSESLHPKFAECYNSINNNLSVKSVLYPDYLVMPNEVYNEIAIFADFKVTVENVSKIIKFKCKIDNFTINHELSEVSLNDLKTTSSPASYFMGNEVKVEDELVWYDGSFQKYRYYRQAAIYMMILQSYVNILHPDKKFLFKSNMIVVETVPKYESVVYSIDNSYIIHGLKEFKSLIIEVFKHI